MKIVVVVFSLLGAALSVVPTFAAAEGVCRGERAPCERLDKVADCEAVPECTVAADGVSCEGPNGLTCEAL